MRSADTGTDPATRDKSLPHAPDGRPLRADAVRNRERIVAAAEELFAARGLEVTLDDIAAHAGLGVGTVYRRFPNRDALVDALFEQRLEVIVGIAEAAAAEADPWPALTGMLERLCAVLVADRGLHEVFVCRAGGPGASTCVRERMAPAVTAVFDRARAAGHLRADAAPTDVPVILRMIAGVAEYAGEVRPELWRRYLALVVDGLRAEGAEDAGRPPAPPLPEPALTIPELDEAKAAWHAGRR